MSKTRESNIKISGEKVIVTETTSQTIDIFGVKNELEKVNRDMDYIVLENLRLKRDFSSLKTYKEKLEKTLETLEKGETVEDSEDLNLE